MKRLLLLMPEHFIAEAYPILSKLLTDMEIVPVSVNVSREAILEAIAQAHFLVWTGTEINREMLNCAKNMQLIQKWGTGIDGIDTAVAKQLGIPIANVPGGNAISVAEHFFTLLLALYKNLTVADASMHSAQWLQAELVNQGIWELYGKTLGIIGFGQIGRAIALRAQAFGMKVIYNKRIPLNALEEHQLQVSFSPLSELVQLADVVGLALPLTKETKGLFDYSMFKLMKSSAVLINVARGAILNEEGLYHAILNGNLAGAGLDVYITEPPSKHNFLLQLPNVVATPHIAGRTKEAFKRVTEECAANIRLVIEGKQAHHVLR
jgi:phosphoglycerate dehydrogenase-like enzyme